MDSVVLFEPFGKKSAISLGFVLWPITLVAQEAYAPNQLNINRGWFRRPMFENWMVTGLN
jgi:hypothetical protein